MPDRSRFSFNLFFTIDEKNLAHGTRTRGDLREKHYCCAGFAIFSLRCVPNTTRITLNTIAAQPISFFASMASFKISIPRIVLVTGSIVLSSDAAVEPE